MRLTNSFHRQQTVMRLWPSTEMFSLTWPFIGVLSNDRRGDAF